MQSEILRPEKSNSEKTGQVWFLVIKPFHVSYVYECLEDAIKNQFFRNRYLKIGVSGTTATGAMSQNKNLSKLENFEKLQFSPWSHFTI